MNFNEVISRNINIALKNENKTIEDIEEVLDYSKKYILNMLNGGSYFTVRELKKIAAFLGVSVDYLCSIHEDISYSQDEIIQKVKTPKGKEGIKIAERLMEIYAYHHKFETEEFRNKCNSIWGEN